MAISKPNRRCNGKTGSISCNRVRDAEAWVGGNLIANDHFELSDIGMTEMWERIYKS